MECEGRTGCDYPDTYLVMMEPWLLALVETSPQEWEGGWTARGPYRREKVIVTRRVKLFEKAHDFYAVVFIGSYPQGADPTPPPSSTHSEGRYKSFEPPPPTGIGEQHSQTISNLGHAALLRRSELPL